MVASALTASLPWTPFLPPEERAEFFEALVTKAAACVELGTFEPLARLIDGWRATAEVYGVPELRAKLTEVGRTRSPRRQRAITAAAGIPNPRSIAVAGPAEVVDFLVEVGGPVALKPANRQAAIGTVACRRAEVAAAWLEWARMAGDGIVDLVQLSRNYDVVSRFCAMMRGCRGRAAAGECQPVRSHADSAATVFGEIAS